MSGPEAASSEEFPPAALALAGHFRFLWRLRMLLRSFAVVGGVLGVYALFYSALVGCAYGGNTVGCPTVTDLAWWVLFPLALLSAGGSILLTRRVREIAGLGSRSQKGWTARRALLVLLLGFTIFTFAFLSLGLFGVGSCLSLLKCDPLLYAPQASLVLGLGLILLGGYLLLRLPADRDPLEGRYPPPFEPPRGATPVAICLVVVLVIGGGWAIGVAFPAAYSPCPTPHAEQVANYVELGLKAGRGSALTSQFVPHQDQGACATYLPGPWLAAWLNFTGPGANGSVGYASIYTPSGWQNLTNGENSTPLWCSNWANPSNGGPCRTTGNLTMGFGASDIPQPDLYDYRNSQVVMAIWSPHNVTVTAHLTWWWESV